jgi:predicted metal-dependent hydrolase
MNESLKDSPKDGPESQFDLWRDADTGRELGAFTVRVSPRARRLSVRVYPDARVEVVAPRRASARLIEAFVAEHREWIETRRVAALRNARPVEPFPPHAISFRASHERWRMHVAGGHGATRIIEFGLPGEEHRVLRAVGSLDRGDLAAALRAWLLKAARVRLEPRLAALAEATGLQYQQLSVRRQRSRWGSCSVRGTISLNACLLFQRPEVVDYLIVHELTHTRHMNHSARFWAAVEQHCPDWQRLDRELLDGWRHVPGWVFGESDAT